MLRLREEHVAKQMKENNVEISMSESPNGKSLDALLQSMDLTVDESVDQTENTDNSNHESIKEMGNLANQFSLDNWASPQTTFP